MGNSLTFNGVNSADYGIVLSGGGTYATPERVITSVEVPGRNGNIQYDEGNYKNIVVTYPAGLARNFTTEYLDFIRKAKSAPVYSRLTDTYHPEYYRYGTLIDELVPDVGTALKSGKFDLPFNCKPQRYLVSGDTPQAFTPEARVLPRFYVYSDMASRTQSDVLMQYLKPLGYSTADIQAMEFFIVSVTVGTGQTITVNAESSSPFFACVMDQDPTTASSSGLLTSTCYERKNFSLTNFAWGTGTAWIIIMRIPETTVTANGTVVFDYDYFTEYVLTNPTGHTANPVIRAELPANNFDDYIFGINDCSLRFDHSTEAGTFEIHAITLNTETMNCYSLPEDNDSGVYINCNKYIVLSNYSMSLVPGNNDLLVGDWCNALHITPRWWTL